MLASSCGGAGYYDMMMTKMVRFSLLLIIATVLLIGGTTGFSQRISPHFPRDANLQARRQQVHRRSLLESTLATAYFSCFLPSSANAAVEVVPTTKMRRSKLLDSIFAQQMATGMAEYEQEVEQYKTALFQNLFNSLVNKTVAETPSQLLSKLVSARSLMLNIMHKHCHRQEFS